MKTYSTEEIVYWETHERDITKPRYYLISDVEARDARVTDLLLIPYNQIRLINSFKECKGLLNKSEKRMNEALLLLEGKEEEKT